jgi:hypothetical protein
MGWSSPDEDFRADYERRLRAEWTRSLSDDNDAFLKCAHDVRRATNDHAAAGIIQAFFRAEQDRERLEAVRAGAGR